MDSSKIEVGDVVRWETDGNEYVVEKVQTLTNEVLTLDVVGGVCREVVQLVRKADPYYGISLPEPPAGYRLAKWGEEAGEAMFYNQRLSEWVPWQGPLVNRNTTYDAAEPRYCIFAIPLDHSKSVENLVSTMQDRGYTVEKVQPPLKSWQFREVPWVVPEPKTLADCVEERDAFCCFTDKRRSGSVLFRRGSMAFYRWGDGSEERSFAAPDNWKFICYLDPPPQKPLSLDDVPDGRCIDGRVDGIYDFRVGSQWWGWNTRTGAVKPWSVPMHSSYRFTVTNYIAEFRGPA